jgi:hypothetical protein
MNKSAIVLSSLVLIAAAAVHADAAPDWCNTPGVNKTWSTDLATLYSETKPHAALYTIVWAICNPDNDARAQAKQVEATRQAWSKKLAMNDADWADVAVWATRDQQSRLNGSLANTDEKKAFSAASPGDQYDLIARSADPAYLADAFGARLSQAGRLSYIERCLTSKEVAWAMCQGDIEALDAAKLSAELRTDTARDGFDRTRLRIDAYNMKATLADHAKAVTALIERDPGYQKLFEIAKTARAEWSKVDAELIALMTAMDDARATNSRKALDGCMDTTWSALSKQIAKVPGKSFTGMQQEMMNPLAGQAMAKVLATPDGYLAALAFTECAVLSRQDDYLLRQLGEMMARWPGFRGPRTTAHTASLAAGVELDDRDAKINYPDVDRRWLHVTYHSAGGSGTGTIESVTPAEGGGVVVTFAKVKGTQQKCVRGKTTNRVVQIRPDGVLVYEYICLEERTETFAEPPAKPTTVGARYADGLEAGRFVTIVEGVAITVHRKGGKQPTHIVGVAVR